jgi:hypothetical protein
VCTSTHICTMINLFRFNEWLIKQLGHLHGILVGLDLEVMRHGDKR